MAQTGVEITALYSCLHLLSLYRKNPIIAPFENKRGVGRRTQEARGACASGKGERPPLYPPLPKARASSQGNEPGLISGWLSQRDEFCRLFVSEVAARLPRLKSKWCRDHSARRGIFRFYLSTTKTELLSEHFKIFFSAMMQNSSKEPPVFL